MALRERGRRAALRERLQSAGPIDGAKPRSAGACVGYQERVLTAKIPGTKRHHGGWSAGSKESR